LDFFRLLILTQQKCGSKFQIQKIKSCCHPENNETNQKFKIKEGNFFFHFVDRRFSQTRQTKFFKMALFPPRVQSPSRGRLEFEKRENKNKDKLDRRRRRRPQKKIFFYTFFQPNVFDSQQEKEEKVPTTTT
jgi:hypothetical protein